MRCAAFVIFFVLVSWTAAEPSGGERSRAERLAQHRNLGAVRGVCGLRFLCVLDHH
jgi:hypothetical protein